MDLPNNKTFCVAPWFQVRNDNNGEKRVCCGIDCKSTGSVDQDPVEFLNSPENLNLKKQLHAGTKPRSCRDCWQDEDNGRISMRQTLNGMLTNNSSSVDKTWIASYFSRKKDWKSDQLLMADIKIGNTCNFACVMCVPENSSMIYNEWKRKPDSFFIKDKLEKDPEYLDRVKHTGYANKNYRQYVEKVLSNKKLKYLKLLGGEPLLDVHLLKQLRSIPEQQKNNLSLFVVTNGSRDLLAIKKYLGDFKSINFKVSLEGTSRVQDYARYGSDWSTVSKNILTFKKLHPNDITIHTTLQTTTILGFEDLARWTEKNKLALSLSVCIDPEYLNFSTIPNKVRTQVKNALKSAQINVKQNNLGDEVLWPVNKIIELIDDTEFDTARYQQFLDYIQWYENGKKITPLKEIFPSLFQLTDDSI